MYSSPIEEALHHFKEGSPSGKPKVELSSQSHIFLEDVVDHDISFNG